MNTTSRLALGALLTAFVTVAWASGQTADHTAQTVGTHKEKSTHQLPHVSTPDAQAAQVHSLTSTHKDKTHAAVNPVVGTQHTTPTITDKQLSADCQVVSDHRATHKDKTSTVQHCGDQKDPNSVANAASHATGVPAQKSAN